MEISACEITKELRISVGFCKPFVVERENGQGYGPEYVVIVCEGHSDDSAQKESPGWCSAHCLSVREGKELRGMKQCGC